jgi:crotonobetainyl-CoA:carnitine CoA-transferase CaiB-like acyl-CoA transferase
MGREDLKDDPRFASMTTRAQHMAETEAVVTAWTSKLPKADVFAATRHHRIPCAPVRTAPEVMNDPHMHARGMLERITHPELGEIVVPTTPLRLHGADKVTTIPSPSIGQHNDEVYGGWLGLTGADLAALKQAGVI